MLLTGEAAVAVAAMFPHVSRFYREFYIERARTCWMTEPAAAAAEAELRLAHIVPAALSGPDACYMLTGTWTEMHRDSVGVWTDKDEAWIDVPEIVGARALVLTMAAGSADGYEKLLLSVNGRIWGRVFLPAGMAPEEIRIPVPADGTDYMLVRIDWQNAAPPREMGLLDVNWDR